MAIIAQAATTTPTIVAAPAVVRIHRGNSTRPKAEAASSTPAEGG
jgi:hypothetical protein